MWIFMLIRGTEVNSSSSSSSSSRLFISIIVFTVFDQYYVYYVYYVWYVLQMLCYQLLEWCKDQKITQVNFITLYTNPHRIYNYNYYYLL